MAQAAYTLADRPLLIDDSGQVAGWRHPDGTYTLLSDPFFGDDFALAVTAVMQGLDTSYLPEHPDYLYFTNQRAVDAIVDADLQFTVERAVDAVGAVLTLSDTIAFDYDDGNNTIRADVRNGSVTNAKLRSSSGYSVLGRAGSTLGSVDDITATVSGQVLRREGTSLEFGALDLANSNAVTGFLPLSNLEHGDAGTILAGKRGTSDATAYVIDPVLGVPGISYGTLGLASENGGILTLKSNAPGDYEYLFPLDEGAVGSFLQSRGPGQWQEWVEIDSAYIIGELGYTPGTGTVTNVTITVSNGVTGGGVITTTGAISIGLGAITPSTVNGLTLTAQTTGFTIAGGTSSKTLTVSNNANVSGTNSGDVGLSGEDYLSISGQTITAGPVNLSGTNVTGTLPFGNMQSLSEAVLLGNPYVGTPWIVTEIGLGAALAFDTSGSPQIRTVAMTGDVTTPANSFATTIANSAVTNAKIANATIDLTAKVTGALPYANGGTNASTAWTQGSILFAGASAIAQDNANFYYDATLKALGVGSKNFALTAISNPGSEANPNLLAYQASNASGVPNMLLMSDAASGNVSPYNFVIHAANDTSLQTFGAMVRFVRSRGSLASPTALQTTDVIGGIYGVSKHSTGWTANTAAIRMVAKENQTATGNGAYVDIATTSTGATGRTVRMIIDGNSSGSLVGLGVTPINGIDVPLGAAFGTYAGVNSAPSGGGIFSGSVGVGTASPPTKLSVAETKTLSAGLSDGYSSALTLTPTYSGAFTVTRHNYIDFNNATLAASAAVTDAAVMRFDAAAGTHKAVDSGTTKTSPGTVSAWVKININGAVYYIPSYTSKTT